MKSVFVESFGGPENLLPGHQRARGEDRAGAGVHQARRIHACPRRGRRDRLDGHAAWEGEWIAGCATDARDLSSNQSVGMIRTALSEARVVTEIL